MVGASRTNAFRTNRGEDGRILSPEEREQLLRPYLPADLPQPSPRQPPKRFQHRQRVRPAIRHLIHSLVFAFIHAVFSAYVRCRKTYHAVLDRTMAIMYHHHRTPEIIQRDVKGLNKVPQHLSVILRLPAEGGNKDRLETLFSDACDIAAWTASAGIPMLSIYERTGALKRALPHLHGRISRTLVAYFGADPASRPSISIRAPNLPSYSPPHSPPADGDVDGQPRLSILLLDASDGRQTLVDLTKTLAEMSQHGKLSPADISSELIDAEISESVMGEPDLLITFADRVVLDGYPPWQARLTEIFCMQDNQSGVGYHLFLRALYRYARAEFRVGK